MEELRELLYDKLGVTVEGKISPKKLGDQNIRTFNSHFNTEEHTTIYKRILTSNYLFLIGKGIKYFEYKGATYKDFNNWVNSLKIVSQALIKDILTTDLTVEQCILRNESNPEFFEVVPIKYNNTPYDSVNHVSRVLGISPVRIRYYLREGYSAEEAVALAIETKAQKTENSRRERIRMEYNSSFVEVREVGKELGIPVDEIYENPDLYAISVDGEKYIGLKELSSKYGLDSRVLRPVYLPALHVTDLDERDSIIAEWLDYYVELFTFEGQEYRSHIHLLETFGISSKSIRLKFYGNNTIEEAHDALRDAIKARSIRDEFKAVIEVYVGECTNLEEAYKRIAKKYGVDESSLISLRTEAKGNAETFERLLKDKVSRWDRLNQSKYKSLTDLCADFDIDATPLRHYISRVLKLEVLDFCNDYGDYILHYDGKQFLAPGQLSEITGFENRLCVHIFSIALQYEDSDRRDEVFEEEIEYHIDLLHWNGHSYTSIVDMCASVGRRDKYNVVRRNYNNRINVDKIHAMLQ